MLRFYYTYLIISIPILDELPHHPKSHPEKKKHKQKARRTGAA